MMTDKQIIETELECVKRQQCDRDCNKCDLVMDSKDIIRAYNHVHQLLELEEQGKLIKLPCKEGDTIYYLGYNRCHLGNDLPDNYSCEGCEDECDLKQVVKELTVKSNAWIVSQLMQSKDLFYFDKDDAEKALKKKKEK